MIMNQGGTTTMADKETLDLIETLKANNEELLKQFTASLPKRELSTQIS